MAADPTPKSTVAERKTLATADDLVVTLRAGKDGKVRLSWRRRHRRRPGRVPLTCASEDARVMLPGDPLELTRRGTDYLLVHESASR